MTAFDRTLARPACHIHGDALHARTGTVMWRTGEVNSLSDAGPWFPGEQVVQCAGGQVLDHEAPILDARFDAAFSMNGFGLLNGCSACWRRKTGERQCC